MNMQAAEDSAASSNPGKSAQQVHMRETAQLKCAGQAMLLPLAAPQFLANADLFAKQLVLFDLAAASPAAGTAGIVVAQFEEMPSAVAVSADGGSLCIGDFIGDLQMFDTSAVVAAAATVAGAPEGTPAPAVQVEPRAQNAKPLGSKELEGIETNAIGAIAFSQDGGRLFVMRASGPVTVHDARSKELPILRTLPFTGGKAFSNFTLANAGPHRQQPASIPPAAISAHFHRQLLAAAGGGPTVSDADTPCARQVRVWSVEIDQETQLRTLDFDAIADSVALRPDAGQLAVGLRDGTVQVFSTATWELVVEPFAPTMADDGASSATEDPAVLSLQFSPDGTKLAAGRRMFNSSTIYDLSATATVVSQFHHDATKERWQ
jgi:hypothetical protein